MKKYFLKNYMWILAFIAVVFMLIGAIIGAFGTLAADGIILGFTTKQAYSYFVVGVAFMIVAPLFCAFLASILSDIDTDSYFKPSNTIKEA